MEIIKFVVETVGVLLCIHSMRCQNVDFADRAFVSIWNSPSAVCENRYGVKLDLSYFDIVANHNDTFGGDEIVIFYSLGLYPHIDGAGNFINGGLPQLANITAHLAKVAQNLDSYIPNVDYTGLVVIDWEAWRPIFRRDGYNEEMKRYIYASEDLVRKKHPDWSKDKIENEARIEFENAARVFIQSTLDACRKLRPWGYWGLYLYPNCYNRKAGQRQCSNTTIEYNDRLSWMYEASTALYPSIYLHAPHGTPTDNYDHVYGTLKEALRVKKEYGGKYLSIVPYSTYIYGSTGNFYNKKDLVNSIQQVAEAGMNAVALWGSSRWFRSARQCEQMRDYIDKTLGPFIKNVTMTARNCSQELCNSHGRCFKTDWNRKSSATDTLYFESAFKRLFVGLLQKLFEGVSNTFTSIRKALGTSKFVTYDASRAIRQRYSDFSCSCFKGWTGSFCEQKNHRRYMHIN